MNQTLEKLKDIEKNGYQIDFGNVFNHAFDNYKKIALYAGSVLVIFAVLFTVFMTAAIILTMGTAGMTEELSSGKFKIENIVESNPLTVGVITILVSCLFGPFQASFLKMADHGEKDENFPVSSLFSFYQSPYLKEILIATFFISTINFAQSSLISQVRPDLLGAFITYLISFFITCITLLTIPLIIFGNLPGLDAIKHSIQIVFKQPFIIFALMIVAIIGTFVGLMACCVGVFFTMPFLYSMNYAIYSAIIGIDNPVENE